jgi:threonine/homoserine/homoserine lactone efflux protein
VICFCLGFATLGLACNYAWVLTGSLLQGWLGHPRYGLWINGLLALLTLLTVIMFWLSE